MVNQLVNINLLLNALACMISISHNVRACISFYVYVYIYKLVWICGYLKERLKTKDLEVIECSQNGKTFICKYSNLYKLFSSYVDVT